MYTAQEENIEGDKRIYYSDSRPELEIGLQPI